MTALGQADSRTPTPASAVWSLNRAGRILVAAGALDEDLVHQLGTEIEAALTVRSRSYLDRHGAAGRVFGPVRDSWAPGRTPPPTAAQPMRVIPLGQTFRLASERAPADLHVLSLVATPAEVTIAVAMRMRWPPDGSSADLELTWAGYHHLPYDHLWLTDDHGTRYPVTFDGEGGTATWQGVLPARWASVLARLPLADTAADVAGPEVFAPLAVILPELEGTRFALAGLSVAAGESYLHVAATGLPERAERFAPGWRPGFSWWVRDDGGNWHVAAIAEPGAHPPGEADFRLRLIPPLSVPLDLIEVLVEAGRSGVRVIVPMRGAPEMPDT